jgi:hypothetical protein
MVALSLGDPLEEAIRAFETRYRSYVYTMKVNHDGEEGVDMVLRYYYMKPGFVRMEMLKPFKGVVLTYDPERGKAYLRPFPGLRGFVLTLDPDSRLIRGPSDHRVDESDILTLLYTVRDLLRKGRMHTEERGDHIVVRVSGEGGHRVRGRIAEFLLRFSKGTLFPLYAASFDEEGDLIEEVFFEDVVLNPELSLELFRIKGK